MSFKYELLEFIKDLGAMAGDYVVSPYEFNRRLGRAIRSGGGYRSSNYYATINRLEKNGLIKKKKVGKYISFRITERGRAYLKRRPKMERRTDAFSTVIVFDIPEDKHGARDSFRRYLVRNGFILLQKSVLVGPYKFSSEIKDLAEELGIKNHITVLSAKIDRI